MWRDDAYLLDMLIAARRAIDYTNDVSWGDFEQNDLVRNAVMRMLEVIGEAARRAPGDSVARSHRIAQQTHPRVLPDSRRQGLGCHPRRLAGPDIEAGTDRAEGVAARSRPADDTVRDPLLDTRGE